MNDSLNTSENSSLAESQDWAAAIGLDWGEIQHAYFLRDSQGTLESGTLNHESVCLHQWLKELERRFQGRPVAFALEGLCTPLVAALREYHWVRIYSVHPTTSARFRQAFAPSGAKDDLPDAKVLLELLLHHHDKLRLLPEHGAQITRALDGLNRARRKMVDRRTALNLQTRAALKDFYPQALELIGGSLWTDMANDFLKRWPDLTALKRCRAATLKKFFHKHGLRRPETIQARLQLVEAACSLHTDWAIIDVSKLTVKLLLSELRQISANISRFEKEIASAFKEHENWHFFKSLPGAGPAMAPRLLCAMTLAKELDTEAMQKYFGMAPVIVRSGTRHWVHRRWNAPRFLHQTFLEWAGLTVMFSSWSKAYYEHALAAGKGRYTALRALAFKWLRILAACMKSGEDYDEHRYTQRLVRKKPPFIHRLTISDSNLASP